MIVELKVGDGPNIEPQPIGPGNRRYRKHFLDLRGLGVRDLCHHGDDLLVLAGPTMEFDGRTAVFRWRGALTSQEEAVLHTGELRREFDVAFGKGEDRADGITVLRMAERPWWYLTRRLTNVSADTMKSAPMSSILESRAVAGVIMPALTRWHEGRMPEPGYLALDMSPHCFLNANRRTRSSASTEIHRARGNRAPPTGVEGRSGQRTKRDTPVTPR